MWSWYIFHKCTYRISNSPAESLKVFHLLNMRSVKVAKGRPAFRFWNNLLGVQSEKSMSGYATNPNNLITLVRIKLPYLDFQASELIQVVSLQVWPARKPEPRVHFKAKIYKRASIKHIVRQICTRQPMCKSSVNLQVCFAASRGRIHLCLLFRHLFSIPHKSLTRCGVRYFFGFVH